ncbi:hypothetical protein EYV94_13175 [Puteibacter caeruleilacunae]|nr:hypothetical protein EYV94_13175 [Puteibacter caeruleilacunae]
MTNKIAYILIGLLACGLFSCQEQTEVYEEFVVPGGKTYPGQVINPVVYSGKNRAKIIADKPVDPLVTEVRVFWNFYADSVSVPVNDNDTQVEIVMEGLPENSYSFIIRTYDDKGNISVPMEVFGDVYGADYEKTLVNRTLNSATLNEAGELTLLFGEANVSNGAVGSVVSYINTEGNETLEELAIEESELVITDYASDAKYLTQYVPDSLCIDVFSTGYTPIVDIEGPEDNQEMGAVIAEDE